MVVYHITLQARFRLERERVSDPRAFLTTVSAFRIKTLGSF